MNKLVMLVFCIGVLYHSSYAQNSFVLSGTVTDENNKPLPGATVFLHPINQATITNAQGNFNIGNLPANIYQIEIAFIGYKTLIDSILLDRDKIFHAHLKVSTLSLQEVVVHDNYAETRKKEESLNIEVVNDDYLKQNLGGSLMKSLERLPGVSTIDIGSGQSKPVIRGLGFNRVVVVENNVKHEGQQWGKDHGLEIDQYAVNNIVVIKGPASLMYGSDAIGGVIDMKSSKIPAKNSFGGTIDLTGKSNNNSLGTSLFFYGRKDKLYASFRATIVDYGDYRVPTDSVDIYSYRAALQDNYVRNTAGNEHSLHATLGFVQQKFKSKLIVSNVTAKSGFFANAYGLEPRQVDTDLHDKSNRDINYPFQTVNHFKAINSNVYQLEKVKVELDLGFQNNYRQEWSDYVPHGWMPPIFPDTLDFPSDLDREFKKNVYSGNAKLNYRLNTQTQLFFGINSEYQDNQIDGHGFIIPEYKQFTAGTYFVAKHSFSEKSIVQFGLRFDGGNINTEEYFDWFPSPVTDENNDTTYQYLQRAEDINRRFSSFSYSLGYNFHPDNWLIKANVGKSFRMPIAKELAANGVNYHQFSFEVGNPNLSPEESYQFDFGIEYSSNKFAIGTSPFVNYFTNYIYLNPSSEHDRLYGNGNQVFYYTECKVFRYGGEMHAHYELFKSLQLGIIGEYVYSKQLSGTKKGFTLPFSPPASAVLNIKYQKQKLGFMQNAYVSLDYRLTATQNNIVPPEEKTPGYQLFNLGMGGEISIKEQKINITIQAQNLLNTKYFNHTSFYRLINVPEQGRNIIVNISVPFSGKIKQKLK